LSMYAGDMTMPATRKEIAKFLTSDNGFTQAEKWIVKMQYRNTIQCGNFEEKLWELICAADEMNRALISMGFPELVNAYNSWTYRDLGDRIREAGLDI